MSKSPLACICIPNFNNSQFILKTLKSIQNQDHTNIKIQIFDNCSSDNSVEILKSEQEKDPRIDITINSKNLGAEDNFTQCLQSADGSYTAIFHSDDIYEPNIISEAINQFTNFSDVLAIATHSKVIDANGNFTSFRFVPKELQTKTYTIIQKNELLPLVLKYGNFITCPSVIAKSQVYRELVAEWRGKRYKSSADLDVWLRINKHGPLLFINKPLLSYRASIASFSYNLSKKRISSHDLFLVLDEAIKKNRKSLTTQDLRFYNFLKFKDISLRSINIIRNKETIPFPSYGIDLKDIIFCLFSSKFHFKYSLVGACVFLLRIVFSQFIRKHIIFKNKNY